MDEHVERLLDSAHIVGFRDLPVTADQVKTAINQTIAANEFSSCYIRPMIYLDGAMSLTVEAGTAALRGRGVGVEQLSGAPRRKNAASAPILRRSHACIPNIMMTKAKVSGNYVSSILAKTESHRAGFDEAIMLGPDGYVAECTGENLFSFVAKQNHLHDAAGRHSGGHHARHPDDAGCGIWATPWSRSPSRATSSISPTKCLCAERRRKSSRLREIDFRVIGDGKTGPVNTRLQPEFDKLVSGRHARSAEWLAPVPALNAAAVPSKHDRCRDGACPVSRKAMQRRGKPRLYRRFRNEEASNFGRKPRRSAAAGSLDKKNGPALHADLPDLDLRGHRHAGAGARHSYRQLLHALRQSHEYGRRECHRRTGRHGCGAAVLFGHGRDHHFDSVAGEGGRPHRGATRYLWRRDQVPFAVAAEAGNRNDVCRYQRHRAARARHPAQYEDPAHRVADESDGAGRRSGKDCGAGAEARPDLDH